MSIETRLAETISDLAGFNILKKTRKREYIEARSLYFHILNNFYDKRICNIQRTIKVGGRKLNHATILHSLNNFSIYKRYNKRLEEWLANITLSYSNNNYDLKRAFIKSKINLLDDQEVDKVLDLIQELYEESIIKKTEELQ